MGNRFDGGGEGEVGECRNPDRGICRNGGASSWGVTYMAADGDAGRAGKGHRLAVWAESVPPRRTNGLDHRFHQEWIYDGEGKDYLTLDGIHTFFDQATKGESHAECCPNHPPAI